MSRWLKINLRFLKGLKKHNGEFFDRHFLLYSNLHKMAKYNQKLLPPPTRHTSFFSFFRMMPSSPLIGRRSGTASPQMDHIDVVKDNVIGELASRIGRPIPEFNKNKRGM